MQVDIAPETIGVVQRNGSTHHVPVDRAAFDAATAVRSRAGGPRPPRGRAIRRIDRGGDPAATGSPGPSRRYVAHPGTAPTAAEMRVLRLLTGSLSLAEIAREIHVSRNTVKSHVRRLYVRLEVGGRTDAVTVARERGLL
ncbi:MAG: response regulator transcription factor [Solirubrobacteraceae bacterium]